MKAVAKINFTFSYYHPREGKTTLVIDTPEQTMKKIVKLENAGFPIYSEIIVTAQIANCTFKKFFYIRRHHILRYDDFQNFRRTFNI